jgi:hypothetical protein
VIDRATAFMSKPKISPTQVRVCDTEFGPSFFSDYAGIWRRPEDSDFLLEALRKSHSVFGGLWEIFKSTGARDFRTWVNCHKSDVHRLASISCREAVHIFECGIPDTIKLYRTFDHGNHRFRTVTAQRMCGNGRYSCGVVAGFKKGRRTVLYHGEALRFLTVEFAGEIIHLVNVRWFDTKKIVRHRLRQDVPIVVTTSNGKVAYIPKRNAEAYEPFIQVGNVVGQFYTCQLRNFHKPCKHGTCKIQGKIGVPCRVSVSDDTLDPWRKWRVGHDIPENESVDVQPIGVNALALMPFSRIHASLEADGLSQ